MNFLDYLPAANAEESGAHGLVRGIRSCEAYCNVVNMMVMQADYMRKGNAGFPSKQVRREVPCVFGAVLCLCGLCGEFPGVLDV
jgi:hypothetical protein